MNNYEVAKKVDELYRKAELINTKRLELAAKYNEIQSALSEVGKEYQEARKEIDKFLESLKPSPRTTDNGVN